MAYKNDFEKEKTRLLKEKKSLLFSILELQDLMLETKNEEQQLKRIDKLISILDILIFNNDKRLIYWKNSDLQAERMTKEIKRLFGYYNILPYYNVNWDKINKRLDRLGL